MPWINKEMCTGCGICVEECPADAITLEDDGAVIDEEECIRCGNCHDVCREEAARHDSERIPQEIEANLQWVRKLLGKFETEKEKDELLERLTRYFKKEMKVVKKTLERLKALR
jgi:dissimilatory sulfite reductase (desulfoviridin) alpha/beta subunit